MFLQLFNRNRFIKLSLLFSLVCSGLFSGCASTIREKVVDSLGDGLNSNGNLVIIGEDDPDLMGDAFPFLLKSMEILIERSPENPALRVETSKAFTVYSSQWLDFQSKVLEDDEYDKSVFLKKRANGLYKRAYKYALSALELDYPDAQKKIESNFEALSPKFSKKDAPALTWLGLSLVSKLKTGNNLLALSTGMPLVEKIMSRAKKLDPEYEPLLMNEFFIEYYNAQPATAEFEKKMDKHFEVAVKIAGKEQCSPYLTWAITRAIRKQDLNLFNQLIKQALAVDADKYSRYRLSNRLCQRKALWYQKHVEDFIL